MKRVFYTILFIGMSLLFISCKTTNAGNSTVIQNVTPAVYTLSIRIQNNWVVINQLMEKIHKFCTPDEMQIDMKNNFMFQESEVQIKVTSITDKRINEMRNALNIVAGVIMIVVSKN